MMVIPYLLVMLCCCVSQPCTSFLHVACGALNMPLNIGAVCIAVLLLPWAYMNVHGNVQRTTVRLTAVIVDCCWFDSIYAAGQQRALMYYWALHAARAARDRERAVAVASVRCWINDWARWLDEIYILLLPALLYLLLQGSQLAVICSRGIISAHLFHKVHFYLLSFIYLFRFFSISGWSRGHCRYWWSVDATHLLSGLRFAHVLSKNDAPYDGRYFYTTSPQGRGPADVALLPGTMMLGGTAGVWLVVVLSRGKENIQIRGVAGRILRSYRIIHLLAWHVAIVCHCWLIGSHFWLVGIFIFVASWSWSCWSAWRSGRARSD